MIDLLNCIVEISLDIVYSYSNGKDKGATKMSNSENKVSTSVRTKSRLQALGSYFEMACVFSLVVILADMTWLLHDIIDNGMSIMYGIIGALMVIGFVGTVYVTIAHNQSMSNKHCHKIMLGKLDVLKRKQERSQKEARIAKAKAKRGN